MVLRLESDMNKFSFLKTILVAMFQTTKKEESMDTLII